MEAAKMWKKLSSDKLKGQAQYVTVVLLPVVVIGGTLAFYISTQQSATAEINFNSDIKVSEYNSLAALNTLRTFDENHEKLISYNEKGSDSIDRSTLESDIDKSLSYLKSDEIDSVTKGYYVRLNSTGHENPEVNNSEPEQSLYSSEAYIASPKKEPSKLEVWVGAE